MNTIMFTNTFIITFITVATPEFPLGPSYLSAFVTCMRVCVSFESHCLPGCLALSSPHSLHPTYPPFCLNFRYLQSNGTHNPGVNFPPSEMQTTQILTLPKMIN